MSCDYPSVLAASKCFECIPQGIQMGVQTSLLNEISGANLTVDQLIDNARCIASCIPPGMLDEVKTRLLCERVDTLTGAITLPEVDVCTNPLVDDPVTGWVARVVANGGAAPSQYIRHAMCVFANGLDAAGLTSKMIAVNCVVPYDLVTACTPLIVGTGSDPWTNNGFVAADLTIDGLKGNGISKYLKTGVNPSTSFSNNTSAGLTTYNVIAANANSVALGVATGGGASVLQLWPCDGGGFSVFDCYDLVNRCFGANPLFRGYISGNRTAANAASIYRASDTVPFSTVAQIFAGGGVRTNGEMYAFACNQVGSIAYYDARRYSFFAIHVGLTSPQSQQLYTLVRALRGRIGGGFI